MRFGFFFPLILLCISACQKETMVPQTIIIQDAQLLVTDTIEVDDAFLSLWIKKKEQKMPPLEKWTHKINLTYGTSKKSTKWLYDASTGALARLNQFQNPRYKVTNRQRFNEILQLQAPQTADIDLLEELMLGSYVVVGKEVATNSLFETVGTIERAEDGEGSLLILRGIPGDSSERIIEGVGKLQRLPENSKLYELEVQWRDSLLQGRATSLYTVTKDYQNVVHLSGTISQTHSSTLKGIESWFSEQLF